jgi:hypothetical protein
MFRRFRKPRAVEGSVFSPASKETTDQLTIVLIKLIGETVHGKLLRAALVGAVSAGTYYATDTGQTPNPTHQVAVKPAQ